MKLDILAFGAHPDDVVTYPSEGAPKVTSVKLEAYQRLEGILAGIRGQYLLFSDGRVINIRAHEGAHVRWIIG